jgi:hypothetical protein
MLLGGADFAFAELGNLPALLSWCLRHCLCTLEGACILPAPAVLHLLCHCGSGTSAAGLLNHSE